MASTNQSPSAAVRARVSHPIIDSDGHAVEFARALFECVAEVGGRGVVDRLRRLLPVTFGNFSAQQRREHAAVARPLVGAAGGEHAGSGDRDFAQAAV